MVNQTIAYEVSENLATLTLNRPDVANGFNIPMCEEMLAAIEETAQNDQVQFLKLKQ